MNKEEENNLGIADAICAAIITCIGIICIAATACCYLEESYGLQRYEISLRRDELANNIVRLGEDKGH